MQSPEFEKAVKVISDYESQDPVIAIATQNGERLLFHTPNRTALRRVQALPVKKSLTIRWLNSLREGAVFLDVGANFGMYAIYAGKVKKTKTYAFEPESQNFALLNKNIASNQLNDRVLAACAALSDEARLGRLFLSQYPTGSSCHFFGEAGELDLDRRKSSYSQGCLSLTIDSLVERGEIEVPNYIKVDVGGIEHKVLRGAEKTLARPEVEELLVEINPQLAEHRLLLDWLKEKGFVYDLVQALQTAEKKDASEWAGDCIFRRISSEPVRLQHVPPPGRGEGAAAGPDARHTAAMRHALKRITETRVMTDPFPCAVVDNVFDEDYYRELLENFPPADSMVPIGETGRVSRGSYQERLCVLLKPEAIMRVPEPQRSFWMAIASWLYHPDFINGVVQHFRPHVGNRLALLRNSENSVRVYGDGLVVSDRTGYSIGPHTDVPRRLISFIFYLPKDDALRAYGTSIYRPKDPAFVCAGGPHYPFEGFTRDATVEFLPNRLFVFPKSERSFHGVEPIREAGIDRRLLIYNVILADV